MGNPLRAIFDRARRDQPKKIYYTLPLQDVAKLFDLLNSKYNTKPNYWPSVFTPLKGNFWNIRGHTLAYFTNLKEKVYLKGSPDNPDNDNTYPASPGILYSEHYKFPKKMTFGLVIQQRVPLNARGHHDRKLLDTLPPVFGIEGIRTDKDPSTDVLEVHKLSLPVFDKDGAVTGSTVTDASTMTPEAVERALLYGRLCASELLIRRTLNARRNWETAQTFDLKQYPAPWKPQPQPKAAPA